MVTLNHYYIAQTMGTRPIRDGDEIHLIYTLSVGKDIGWIQVQVSMIKQEDHVFHR